MTPLKTALGIVFIICAEVLMHPFFFFAPTIILRGVYSDDKHP